MFLPSQNKVSHIKVFFYISAMYGLVKFVQDNIHQVNLLAGLTTRDGDIVTPDTELNIIVVASWHKNRWPYEAILLKISGKKNIAKIRCLSCQHLYSCSFGLPYSFN